MSSHSNDARVRLRPPVVALVTVVAIVALSAPFVLWWLSSRSAARFGDSEVLDANHLGAATLDLGVAPTTAAFSAENLAPGDRVTGLLVLTNDGTLPLRFGVSAETDGGPLGEWLRFDAWSATGACSVDQATGGFAHDLQLATTPKVLLPLAAEASQPFQLVLPGESATLCLGASLPLSAPNEAQGRQLGVTISLTAEHALEVEQ